MSVTPSSKRRSSMTSPTAIQVEDHSLLLDDNEPVKLSHIGVASTPKTFLNITKCFVGAASFELPWAIKEAGIVGGVFGIVCMCFSSYLTLRLLARCGHLTSVSSPTYPQVGRAAFGTPGSIAAWFGIIAMTVGVCGSYMIFVGTALADILCPLNAVFTPTICVLMVLPFIILLSLLRNYSILAPASTFGIIALIFAVAVVMYDGATEHSIEPLDTYNVYFEWSTYPAFLGNAAFLYLIHSVILPVEQSMKTPAQYPKAVLASIIIVTIVNLFFAVLAYLFYGVKTQGNVIDNLSGTLIPNLVKGSLALDLVFTTGLFLFPMSEALERSIFDPKLFGTFRVEVLRNFIRITLVFLIIAVALAIGPYFAIAAGLSGAFGNNIVGNILPCIFYIRLNFVQGVWRLNALSTRAILTITACVIIVSFGAVMMVLSISSLVGQLVEIHSSGNGGWKCGAKI